MSEQIFPKPKKTYQQLGSRRFNRKYALCSYRFSVFITESITHLKQPDEKVREDGENLREDLMSSTTCLVAVAVRAMQGTPLITSL